MDLLDCIICRNHTLNPHCQSLAGLPYAIIQLIHMAAPFVGSQEPHEGKRLREERLQEVKSQEERVTEGTGWCRGGGMRV